MSIFYAIALVLLFIAGFVSTLEHLRLMSTVSCPYSFYLNVNFYLSQPVFLCSLYLVYLLYMLAILLVPALFCFSKIVHSPYSD